MIYEYLTIPATTVSPAALNAPVYWYDSGTTKNSEPVYYEDSGTYAYWKTTTVWVVSVVGDVAAGVVPTNYFTGSPLTGAGAFSGTMTLTAGCTSSWMWQSINRNRDYAIVNNSEFYRENWQLTRYRISNNTYTPELGDTESTSLSAENGGVTESVAPPTYDSIVITGTLGAIVTPEAGSSPFYQGYKFYPATWKANGIIGWVSPDSCFSVSGLNPIDASYVPILITLDGGTYWFMAAETRSNAESGALSFASWANYDGNGQALTIEYTPTNPGSPIDTGNIDASTDTIPFRCISDLQSYDQQSVDWFKQTQTWIARSPWA